MCQDRPMPSAESTTCLIVGGGPAGMMLALLLARAGVKVAVMEKHADFLRDFRGDTVHASTLRLLDELGWGPRFTQVTAKRHIGKNHGRQAGRQSMMSRWSCTLNPPTN